MTVSDLVLRLPRLDEEDEFLRAHRSTSPDAPNFLHHYEDGMPLSRYLDVLAAQTSAAFLLAFVGTAIVGRVSIRHALGDWHARYGGHIGYVVVPHYRRRGYATEILRQAVAIAREQFGIARVLVTCDEDNLASIRIIEKNGGILEGVVNGPEIETPKRRYWITGASGA